MHSLLFAIKSYETEDEPVRSKWWTAVRDVSNKAKQNADIVELALGCWLIPIGSGLPFLGQSISESEKHSLSFTLMFFEDAPEMHNQKPAVTAPAVSTR
jgi:hypothetical protein